jgi:NCS1 nucleoside transporter family
VDQFWIWAGANLAPINWVLGTTGIVLGLSLAQTVVVIVVGNLLGSAAFALFCVMGHRTGVNAMVLSRLVLGRRGARVVAAVMVLMPMGWVGVNTWVVLDLSMAALARMGIEAGEPARYVVAAVIMLIQVAITAWGFNAIRKFERWTMPVILVVMAAMTVMAAIKVTPASHASTLSGTEQWAAMSTVMTGIGIGWGITWFVYAADYTRFARSTTSSQRIFTAAGLGMFVPVVWLGILGAFIASSGSGGTDPAALVITAFGGMALPVLLLILHGPIATNIVVMYSSVLAVLSLDVKAAQWKIAVAGGVVGSLVLWMFLQSGSFARSVSEWMAALVFWISPWAAMTLVDFFILRRQRLDVAELYSATSRRLTDDVNWPGMISLAAGLVAGWLCLMTAIPGLKGPIAVATGGIDLSWLSGSLVAGLTYYFLARRRFTAPA